MNSYDALTLRYGGALAAGAFLGTRFGNQDEPAPQRALSGLAAGAVTLGPLAATYPLWKSAVNPAAKFLGKRVGGVVSQWPGQISQMFTKGGLARTPVMPFAAAGAAVGLAFSRPEHRMHDAGVGAAVGTAAGVGLKAFGVYKNHWGKAAMPFYAALYAGAAIAGNAMNHEAHEEAGVMNSSGEVEYVSQQEAAQFDRRMDSGMRRRMRNMNVSGEMVFGMGK